MTEPLRPWLPASLARHDFTQDTVGELSYVFLDEIVDRTVTFLIHPWPVADQLGRVRFSGREQQVELPARLPEVQRLLYRRFRRRDPRPGDAFAARIRPDALQTLRAGDEPPDLTATVDGLVYDLSVEARLVAKLAYYGSLAAILPERKADDWGMPPPQPEPATPAPAQPIGDRR
jgi:hypothetical protein